MIPDLIDIGNPTPYRVLPPGIHPTSIDEIEDTFAYTPHRRILFGGFCRATDALHAAGCQLVYLDGSFTTSKNHPGDFDACWDITNVDPNKLDPVLLNFDNKRAAQKAKYGGELFISVTQAAKGIQFLDFFQRDRFSGMSKGILSVQLAGSSA